MRTRPLLNQIQGNRVAELFSAIFPPLSKTVSEHAGKMVFAALSAVCGWLRGQPGALSEWSAAGAESGKAKQRLFGSDNG